MLTGLGLLTPFFIYIGFGGLAQRMFLRSEEAQGGIDSFVFYLAMPALLFSLVADAGKPTTEHFLLLGITSTITACLFCLAFVTGKKGGSDAAVLGLLGSYSNIGYMGPVLSIQVFGQTAGLPAALLFCSEIVVLLPLWSAASDKSVSSNNARRFCAALGHPFVFSVALGLSFNLSGLSLSEPINTAVSGLSNAAAPCALFSLGITFARQRGFGFSWHMFATIALKLLLHPLAVALPLIMFFPHQVVWLGTAILMVSLPPAANIYVLARNSSNDENLAASGVLWGTIISAVTVPIILQVLTSTLLD